MDRAADPSPEMRRILNRMRKDQGLPRVGPADVPGKVTREAIWRIAVEVWKKYPQALNDPDYELGELTLALVEQEIRQRVDDLRRGVKVKRISLDTYLR